VATVRAMPEDVAAGRVPATLASVESVPGDLRTLSVRGLPEDDATALAESLGGARDVRAIVDEAGGHPMFIQELARHASTSGRVRLDDALWSRIGMVEPAARRLLEVLAVAGEPLEQRVAIDAAGVPEAGRAIGVLRVAALARTAGARGTDAIECYHDRIREAVVTRLHPDTLRRHHEALANAMEAASGPSHDAQSLVRHLEAAGLVARAAEQATRAARAAADALAFDRAAAMYEVALRLGRQGDAIARALRIEMAQTLVNAGRGTDAAHAYLAAAEGADTATRLECRRQAAGHLLITGDIERGLETMRDVLAELGERLAPTPRRALLSLLWHRARLWVRGTRFSARDATAISPRDLERIDVFHSVGVGLGLVDTIRGADFQARGLALAFRAGERRRIARGIALDAGLLGSQGPRGNRRAMARMARVAEIIGDDPDPFLRGWALGGTAFVHYLGGRFALGAEGLAAAEPILRSGTQGNIWELNTVRIFRLLALRNLGQWRAMRGGFADCLRDAVRRGDRYAETTLTRAVNLVWVITDETARARRELDAHGWMPPEGGYHMQHWYALRARAELALYEGAGAEARDMLAAAHPRMQSAMLYRAQTIRAEAAWLRGRAAVATGDLESARREAKWLRGQGVGYANAWAAMLDAGVARTPAAYAAARALAQDNDLAMCVAALRMAEGDVHGEEAMQAQGVKKPEQIVAMLLG
jgi:hypothetical protein